MPDANGAPVVGVDPYPVAPGFQDDTASVLAAVQVSHKVKVIRAKILKALEVRPMTSEELSDFLNVQFLNIRPRVTELKDAGKVEKTGARRMQRTGGKANEWRLKLPEPTATVQPELFPTEEASS